MSGVDVQLVADTRDGVGESPVWCPLRRAVIWTDIPGRRLHVLSMGDGTVRTQPLDVAVGSLALTRDDGLLVASERGFGLFDADEAAPVQDVAAVLAEDPDMRFNDGRCDRQGRFLASSMAWTPNPDRPIGALWQLDRGKARPLVEGLVLGNGLAFSPDGRTMYLADTHASRNLVWAFDYDVDNGTPHNRRVFVDFAGSGGRPDGATMDTDGCYWVAATGAGEVRRYTPQGQLDLAIALPVTHPTMPVFAGDDLGTLFVTTLRHPDVAEAAPDGGLFRLRVAQRGIMETFYAQ